MKAYTLIVIGGGSGGLVSARVAAKLGANVALIEKNDDIGGECLHAGCVPSKALIAAANLAVAPRTSGAFGVAMTAKVDFRAVKQHIQSSIKAIAKHSENDEYYKSMGVDVYHGAAKFTGPDTIEVDGKQLTAKRFIISTGSRPAVPPVPGLDDVPYSTNENIFTIDELPKRLLVIGGGPIGCELGQAFQKLGSQVTMLQTGDRLLPREEKTVSALLKSEFEALGATVLTNIKLESLKLMNGQVHAKTDRTDANSELIVDHVLVATGRTANTDLNLDKAGVKTNDRGITINDRLQTSNKNIYAIGDCVGGYQFTHFAAEQAGLAVRNALFPLYSKQKDRAVPWVTFTDPEIGRIGAIEDELIASKTPYNLNKLDYAGIDKAVVEGAQGYIHILSNPSDGKILGATVVGPMAGEIINQIAFAYAQERPFTDLGAGLRAYPNYSFGLKQLASDALIEKAAAKWLVKMLRLR